MFGLYVSVPIACFRKAHAREFLETESIPPPSTCYGFLLSLVGETNRSRHLGCRVTVGRFGEPCSSVVLRTVWRVKNKPLGAAGNTRPDYQQLLTDVRLAIYLDSSEEINEGPRLEQRVAEAIDTGGNLVRFGGLSIGESTHLVNDVCRLDRMTGRTVLKEELKLYTLNDQGQLTLPVWVDHVGSSGTQYVRGDLKNANLKPPDLAMIPRISDGST